MSLKCVERHTQSKVFVWMGWGEDGRDNMDEVKAWG